MAIAGKVAITPGYEWSVDFAYDKLVVVTYGNNVYLSTKPSAGIEPTNEEYWMLLIENVTAEDLENIINGTTPVAKAKDADTVDGYHASDLMSTLKTLKVEGENVVTDLFADTYNNRIVEIHTKADNTSNLPPTLLADDKAYVGFSDGWIHGWMITLSLNNTWSRKIYISLRSNNNYECWEKGSSGSGVWSAWKSYLPLTGGTLGAPYNTVLALKNTASLWALLKYEDTTGVLGHLGFSEKNKPIFVNADATNYYDVLHTGNKPTGSYTGNGSATNRTIDTKGMGSVVMIWSTNGSALITDGASIVISQPNTGWISYSEAHFYNGILTLATTNAQLNASGVKYNYQVL